MNFDNLNELSYRELQAKAKFFGIAANQKKDVLIEELLKQETETNTDSVSEVIVENVEETLVVEEPEVESVAVPTEAEVVVIPVEITSDEVVNEVVEEVIVAQESIVHEVDTDIEADVLATEESVLILEDDAVSMEDDEELEFFEAQEYHEENDSEDLVEMLSGLKLRGIATPAGKKIMFDQNEEATAGQKVNWGINFDGENEEQEENFENEENYNAEEHENRGFKIGGTPKGKHTVFASPELKMGNGVHWTYDDYNKPVAMATTTPAKTAPKNVTTQQKLRFAEASSEPALLNTQTPGKKLQNKEDQINFWLAKGPKTPIR